MIKFSEFLSLMCYNDESPYSVTIDIFTGMANEYGTLEDAVRYMGHWIACKGADYECLPENHERQWLDNVTFYGTYQCPYNFELPDVICYEANEELSELYLHSFRMISPNRIAVLLWEDSEEAEDYYAKVGKTCEESSEGNS